MAESPPPAPPPAPAPSSGWLADALKALFAYLDKPWKVAAVIALFVVGGFGWTAYQKRDEIFAAWLTPISGLKTDLIPAALEKLYYETSADDISIWSVDLSSNSQTFISAKRREGALVDLWPKRLPAIVSVSDVKALLAVIEGHPACIDLVDGSPIVRRLIALGMVRGCAVPIPATAEEFYGVIYLAWKKPPDENAEQVAVSNARQIASTLSTH